MWIHITVLYFGAGRPEYREPGRVNFVRMRKDLTAATR
eukprot:COSAG05_NODE_1695_length_4263_cov_9.673391_3_plen_38_part_00